MLQQQSSSLSISSPSTTLPSTSSTTTTRSSIRTKRRSKRRERKGRIRQQDVQNQDDAFKSEHGSMIWTILLVGLIFCLADVAYILQYVDQQNSGNDGIVGGLAISKSDNNNQHHQQEEQRANLKPTTKSQTNRAKMHEQHYKPSDFVIKTHSDVGNDDHSPGMTLEEAQMMEHQLQRHEFEIYNRQKNQQEQNDKQHEEEDSLPSSPLSSQEWVEIRKSKGPILDMLRDAKIKVRELDPQVLRDLPTWAQVTDLYGSEPRIYGLETCQDFQRHSDPAEHFVSTAGTFNSGTNLMAEYLIANCHMEPRMKKYGKVNRGIRWQVPWGKHSPPGTSEFRKSHKTPKDRNVDDTNILPGVTIRDPYVWMQSMCRHEYASRWHHDPDRHCPNLIPDEEDLKEFPKYLREGEPIPLHIQYNGFWKHHETLVGQWNDWYREYWEIKDLWRLIVRFEDLLFHPRNVTEALCKCVGGSMKRDGSFQYIIDSAKKGPTAHGPMASRTGFIKAIIKYGNVKGRHDKFTEADLEYAKEHLDKEMMSFFRYKHPDELLIKS